MLAAALFAAFAATATATNFSSYFANWAKYHLAPYTYDASNLAPLAPHLSELNYAFLYFCPPPGTNPLPYWAQPPYGSCDDSNAYTLLSVEPSDKDFLATITGYKAQSPGLSVLLSVGGWNFPSAYWSAMAATSATRSTFIQSALSWISQTGTDGLDIDWEYPCSPARSDPVEITCQDFQTVADTGGSCPADTTNIVLLFKELSAALFPLGKKVTVASQAAKPLEIEMAIAALDPYVSSFHIMSYDYAVSDIPGAGPFSPNAPLYTPAAPGAVQMSISYSVGNYLSAGVHPSKISVGIPLYAHTWYNPTLQNVSNGEWKKWGGPTYIQGSCCGPFATTNGGKPGPGAQQCGTLMYSEVLAAIGSGSTSVTAFDNETQSDIAYFTGMGEDGVATPGTWITYNSERSAVAIAKYAKGLGLGGVFVFDSSMDTMDGSDFTYSLSLAVAKELSA